MATPAQDGPPTNSLKLTYKPSSPFAFLKHEQTNKIKPAKSPFRPGLLLRLFLELKSLTREKTFNLFLSQLVLPLLGLLTHLQALDFSRSRACLFCRISELAIAAAMATTPTTTTSFAAPLSLCLLRWLLCCSSALSCAFAAFGSLACARPGFALHAGASAKEGAQHALGAPPAVVRFPRGRPGCLGPCRRHSPGLGSRARLAGGGRTALLRALGLCTPRTLCKSKWLWSEFGGTPRPVPLGGGWRREAVEEKRGRE